MKLAFGTALAALAAASTVPAEAGVVFDQGFEANAAGWLDSDDSWSGNIARVASGTNGIASFNGSYHAIFTQTNGVGGLTAGFTRFDGYRNTFPGTYSASAAIYLDTGWGVGEGFDYSVASSGTDGNHQRDFIFHVAQDSSMGQLLVGGSNNSNFDPVETLELGNHFVVTTSGWYIFEHVFRDDGGVLAVDLNLRDALGNLLFTETRSSGADTIPAEVGGNRYGWFTNIDIAGGIAIDDTSLTIGTAVPEPGTVGLIGVGVLGLVLGRRRRK